MLYLRGYFFVRCKSIEDKSYKNAKEIEKNVFLFNGRLVHRFSREYLEEKLSEFKTLSLRRTSSKFKTMERGVENSYFIEAVAKKL